MPAEFQSKISEGHTAYATTCGYTMVIGYDEREHSLSHSDNVHVEAEDGESQIQNGPDSRHAELEGLVQDVLQTPGGLRRWPGGE